MFIVDSHCDSIQQVDHCRFGIVNPHNYSTKHQQIQFVAMMTGWPGDSVDDAWRRACRYTGLFCMSMASEQDKVIQIKTYADIERAFAEGKHGALLTIESATGLKSSPKLLRDFYNVGVRVVGLTWLTNDMGKSNRVVAVRHGEVVDIDIVWALAADRMYKNKLREGDLDKFTPEQIEEMKSICQARKNYIERLEDVLYSTGI